ncbi:winged helix-turn-helix domain-containing protein [Corynebacterium pseudotuberculosis]
MRSELVTHLPIAVDSSSSQPLPVQITSHIRSLVSQKIIAPGDHIPSSRSLAAQLGVSRGTVLAAYEQLSAEGYLLAAHGSGTMINPHLAALQPRHPQSATPSAHLHLPPCLTWNRASQTRPRSPIPHGVRPGEPRAQPHRRHLTPSGSRNSAQRSQNTCAVCAA